MNDKRSCIDRPEQRRPGQYHPDRRWKGLDGDTWADYSREVVVKFHYNVGPFLWAYIWLWYQTVLRYRLLKRAGRAGWFWAGVLAVTVALVFVGVSVFGTSPRARLTEELLALARQYHADHSSVVSDPFAGTVTLTVDGLREAGYNVRRFDRYDCDGRDTNILIRADDAGGYKVMNYGLQKIMNRKQQ